MDVVWSLLSVFSIHVRFSHLRYGQRESMDLESVLEGEVSTTATTDSIASTSGGTSPSSSPRETDVALGPGT